MSPKRGTGGPYGAVRAHPDATRLSLLKPGKKGAAEPLWGHFWGHLPKQGGRSHRRNSPRCGGGVLPHIVFFPDFCAQTRTITANEGKAEGLAGALWHT